jgi:quercetin dioxygenase-like cupin family protein
MKKRSFFDDQVAQLDQTLEFWLEKTVPNEGTVNHFSRDFPSNKTRLNGQSKEVMIQQVFRDHDVQELFVEVSAGGYVPIHDHGEHYCVVKVVKGCVYDPVSKNRYSEGEIYMIEPCQKHGVICSRDTSYVTWNTPDMDTARHIYHTGRYRAKNLVA